MLWLLYSIEQHTSALVLRKERYFLIKLSPTSPCTVSDEFYSPLRQMFSVF